MSKLQWQIAQETQLLAEEQWIINALQLVKKERNSLQIERLNLESLKMQKYQGPEKTDKTNIDEPSTSVIEIMKNTNNPDAFVFDETMISTCNGEELNLNCTNSIFVPIHEEEDLDEDENFDFMMDMNTITYTEPNKSEDQDIDDIIFD